MCRARDGTRPFPKALCIFAAFDRCQLECGAVEEIDIEPREGLCALLEPVGQRCLHCSPRFFIQLLLPHRQSQNGRALEDRELFGAASSLLDNLDPARTSPNHADPFA